MSHGNRMGQSLDTPAPPHGQSAPCWEGPHCGVPHSSLKALQLLSPQVWPPTGQVPLKCRLWRQGEQG